MVFLLGILLYIHFYLFVVHETLTLEELPDKLEGALPDLETLKNVLDHCSQVELIRASSEKQASAFMSLKLSRVVAYQAIKLIWYHVTSGHARLYIQR